MNTKNFAKGIGVGMIVGSAIGMTIISSNKRGNRQRKVSKTIKTVGDIVENIGNVFTM